MKNNDLVETARTHNEPYPHRMEQRYFWLSIILIGSWYLYLNFCIPLYADDYTYSMGFHASRQLESLTDILASAGAHYRFWGGRLATVIISHLALLGKWQTGIFRVLNTCVFLGLNLLLVDFARNKLDVGAMPDNNSFSAVAKKHGLHSENRQPIWMLFLLSFSLFWLFVRTLGETTLWLVGSVTYLWIFFFILLFLRLSIALYNRNSFSILISHVLVGFLAGCGFESTSLTGMMMFLILFFKRRDYSRRAAWQIPGFLAYLAGYILLIAAPGNTARAEYIDRGEFFPMLVNNIPAYIELHLYSWEILLLLLILILAALRKRIHINWATWLFIGAGFFNNGLMLASPTLPLRASFASSAFFICAIISLLSNSKLIAKQFLGRTLIVFTALSMVLAVSDGISYWEARVLDKERKSIARAALGNNESTMEWPLSGARFNRRVFERDIQGSSNFWVNNAVANYYGFDAVLGKEPGFEYYDEAEPWLTVNRNFDDVRLIDVSKYCDSKRCYLYFRLSVDESLDVNWNRLFFQLYYTYDGALRHKIIGFVPDNKYSRQLWARIDIRTRPYQISENNYVFVCAIPRRHSSISRIEFSIESKAGTYRWARNNGR